MVACETRHGAAGKPQRPQALSQNVTWSPCILQSGAELREYYV